MAILTHPVKVVIIPYFLAPGAGRPADQAGPGISLSDSYQFHHPVDRTLFCRLSRLSAALSAALEPPLFILGAVIGVSLALMGMMVIMSRKKVITKIIGYLSMENGVLLFSLFIAEMPFIIEVLIVVDLLMIIVLSAVLAFGIDSSVEAFHKRLNQLGLDFED